MCDAEPKSIVIAFTDNLVLAVVETEPHARILKIVKSALVKGTESYCEAIRSFFDSHCTAVRKVDRVEDTRLMQYRGYEIHHEVFSRCPGSGTPHDCCIRRMLTKEFRVRLVHCRGHTGVKFQEGDSVAKVAAAIAEIRAKWEEDG